MIICDTHVMLFWADAPEWLSPRANELLEQGIKSRSLACADISLWEIAMLCRQGRVNPQEPVEQYIDDITTAMRLEILSITPEIAQLSQAGFFSHKDPADRLIAATAISHRIPLITKDEKLTSLRELNAIW